MLASKGISGTGRSRTRMGKRKRRCSRTRTLVVSRGDCVARGATSSHCDVDDERGVVAEFGDRCVVEDMTPRELFVGIGVGEHAVDLTRSRVRVEIRADLVLVEPSHGVAPAGGL